MNLLASLWGIYAFAAFRGKNNKCTTNALSPRGRARLESIEPLKHITYWYIQKNQPQLGKKYTTQKKKKKEKFGYLH